MRIKIMLDMSHIVDACPLTKFDSGLQLLHEAEDDAVKSLEFTATTALAKWKWLVLFKHLQVRVLIQNSHTETENKNISY